MKIYHGLSNLFHGMHTKYSRLTQTTVHSITTSDFHSKT